MKTLMMAIGSVLLLTACSSMQDRDNESNMGAGTGPGGTYNTGTYNAAQPATGPGSSSTGQPYGAPAGSGVPQTGGTGIPGGGPR